MLCSDLLCCFLIEIFRGKLRNGVLRVESAAVWS